MNDPHTGRRSGPRKNSGEGCQFHAWPFESVTKGPICRMLFPLTRTRCVEGFTGTDSSGRLRSAGFPGSGIGRSVGSG